MKAFKSIFRLILAGGLCLGLAACGTEDTGGGRGSESGQMEEGQEDGQKERESAPENPAEGAEAPVPSEPYVLVREVHDDNMPQILYDYNERGDLTLIQVFYERGEGLVLEYIEEYENEYKDAGGRITVRNQKMVVDGVPGSPMWEYEEEYDAQNRLIRKTTIKDGQFTEGEVFYEYDAEGRLIRKSGQDTETSGTELPETYEYDAAGNMIKQTVWNEDGTMEGWREFTYDEEGRQTQQKNFRPDGTLDTEMSQFTWEYEYDAQGRIADEKQKAPSGGTTAHNTYEYDAQGGLRKKTDETYHITYEYLPLSEYLQGR